MNQMDKLNKNKNNTTAEKTPNKFGVNCFVCDSIINDKCYKLSKCYTQRSKSRVIEKLGEIIGEDYMIVVSESDVICRSCANLVNNLDRLEQEMNTIQSVIYNFLKKKYSLNEDRDDIIKSPDLNVFLRQPSALGMNKEKATSSGDAGVNGNAEKSNSNQQFKCEVCSYTATYSSDMMYHFRKHHLDGKSEDQNSSKTINKTPGQTDSNIPMAISHQESSETNDKTPKNDTKKRKASTDKVIHMNEDGGVEILHKTSENNYSVN